MTPDNARTEAEERSSIPAMMRRVSPKARIVPTDICVEMFLRFSADTKCSLEIQQMMKRSNSTK
jgi:hypothetical protein